MLTIGKIICLLDKVTPGEWKIKEDGSSHVISHYYIKNEEGKYVLSADTVLTPEENIEFIAQSKEIIKWLLDKLEEQRKIELKNWNQAQEYRKYLGLRFQAARNVAIARLPENMDIRSSEDAVNELIKEEFERLSGEK